MSKRFSAEILTISVNGEHEQDPWEWGALVGADLDLTQVVEKVTTYTHPGGQVSIKAVFLATGLPEATAAANRARANIPVPADVTLIRIMNGGRDV